MTASSNPVDSKANVNGGTPPLRRAEEAEDLLAAVSTLITQFIRAADEDAPSNSTKPSNTKNNKPILLDPHSPKELQRLLPLSLPQAQGLGKPAFLTLIEQLLATSVNTWHQGFLDKLYASSTPAGLAADLVLSALNTNLHVYTVSPALTVIEKQTSRALASLFGFEGPFAGGVSQPGGSAANQSSLVIARNVLFPETKRDGIGARKFVIFTSKHGHYSVEKAAQISGFGSGAVRAVDVDEQGRMLPAALEEAILTAKEKGETPFYVNATAGTTVLGSFDPLVPISKICRKYDLWLHVDGSWGGSVVFSPTQKEMKLKGVELADSISICPHKMLNIPLTCSFLLGKDLRKFHAGMTLPAGYLFHQADTSDSGPEEDNYYDLADLTPQCGRRGDSLKLALVWLYHGTAHFSSAIDEAFSTATHLCTLLQQHPSGNFSLVSANPPPCLQVCFYYKKTSSGEKNSKTTERLVHGLIKKGFMVDFAPGREGEGKFLRVVVNIQTQRETVEGLVRACGEVGMEEGL